jgi:hypothetical protein
MRSFIIESFQGGISDFEGKGIKGSFKFGSALNIRTKVDTLSCNQALTSEGSGTIADFIYWLVPDLDGSYVYGFGGFYGKIYKRDEDGAWSLVYTDADGGIKGATLWFSDAGKAYLYWATSTKLHRKELPGQSNWSDVDADAGWPKTTLTSTTWHTMKPANGALMICNKQYLAMVGYDSSFTANALDLIKGNIAKTLIERGDYLFIATENENEYAGTGGLFIWDGSASSWLKKKSIPVQEMNGLIDTEVTLLQAGAVQSGPTYDGSIYYSDLINVTPLTSFPGGGHVKPDGVDVYKGMALFGVYGNGSGRTGVYSYGRTNKNAPFVLNLEYPLTCDEIGAVRNVNLEGILISYKNGATLGVKNVDTSNKATAVYESLDLKVPPDLPARPVNWQMVKLTTAPIVSGTKISCKYKINKSGSWTTAYLQNESADFDDVGETEADFLVGAEGKIFEFQLTLTPTGNTSPEVYRAEVFFE